MTTNNLSKNYKKQQNQLRNRIPTHLVGKSDIEITIPDMNL